MHGAMLPHELIDIIIDHLHDDRVALANCSMVCKAWLASSRFHLFSDILLSPRYCDDILSLPPPSIYTVPARRLMLTDKDFLPPGIEKFSSVRAFYLRASSPDADMLSRIPVIFPRITTLELNCVAFDSLGDLIQLVCSPPCLETLSLFMCTWKQEWEQPPANIHLSPRLHTLNILTINVHLLLDWLTSLPSLPPLTTLRIYSISEPDIPLLGDMLRTLGASLQHLTLDLRDHDRADLLPDHIDIGHNTNLRSFTLINGWPKLLYRLLAHRTRENAKLREATLTMYEGKANIPNLDLLDWGELDRLITSWSQPASSPHQPTSDASVKDGVGVSVTLILRVYAHALVSSVNQEMVERRFMPLCGAKGIVKYVSERERVLRVRERLKGPVETCGVGEVEVKAEVWCREHKGAEFAGVLEGTNVWHASSKAVQAEWAEESGCAADPEGRENRADPKNTVWLAAAEQSRRSVLG
ncbi:hypothetical protein LshimejAT787_1602560 [Lyophyllum shimeji]|uniref:F-box domain-containing protein n=1 Tax=Lyophyllum shimeji TaxID=47721 RepID=A0A9P3Q064_LYOSH|nr:hypothetical protein LshimejAT787_1602560 [Lyophyllum shimeji]